MWIRTLALGQLAVDLGAKGGMGVELVGLEHGVELDTHLG